MQNTKILALIPAYNEAAGIAAVVTGALAHLPVLVIDDGSTDDTKARAKHAGATVLIQTPNQGKGAALRTGFRWAIDQGCQAVITLDADGQHDPAEIPTFLQVHAASPADLIIGRRDFSQMPPMRRMSNTVGGWLFSAAMGQSIPDNQSGYRLISRRLLQKLAVSAETGFEFDVEMIVTCARQGFTLGWAPIRTIYAGEKSHIKPGRHVVNFLRVVWQTWRKRRA